MATQVGEAVIKLTFDGKDVKASLQKVESTVEKSGKSAGVKWGGAWTVAAGNLIAKGITKIGSLINNTMGNAINRLDILNNFPQVMTSLGYSADEADKSISAMSESLDGLPTSLDAMSADVQKLAASMGNLAKGEVNATSLGLALNDMFLAGGKETEVASAAMEQFNQMLANGRVDMQSWRSMVNAAPGQMNQLAQSILGVNANQADLYKAMQEGTVTFDDFNAAIVKLDKEGGQGFESLREQAEAATGGIATQIQNVSNTLNKIIASALDGNMEDMGKYTAQLTSRLGDLAPTLVQGFSGAFDALIKATPGIIQSLLPAVLEGVNEIILAIAEAVPLFVDMLVEATPVLVEAFITLLQSLIEAIPTVIPQLISALTNLVVTIAQQLTRPDFLSTVLSAALTLLIEIVKVIPQIIVSLADALPTILSNIVGFLLDPNNLAMIIDAAVQLFLGIVMAVPQILGSLLQAFGNLVGNMWEGIKNMFGEFASNFGKFIGDIFKGAINSVIAFIENFLNTPIDIINGFLDIINGAFGWLGVNIGHINRIALPRLAEGGVVDSATTAIIGEDGQEAVLPLEHNTGNWSGLLAETLAVEMQEQGNSGTINVYMTNEINNRLDAEEIGRIMMTSIRRAS